MPKRRPTFRMIPLEKLVRGYIQRCDPYRITEHVRVLSSDEHLDTQPITVRANANGTYRIIDGHHRFMAYFLLGKEDMPCVVQPR